MQCSSCAFENMPGSDACCRCGSPLDLTVTTAVMDVHPPRAGKLRKSLRKFARPPQSYFTFRDNLHAGARKTSEVGAQLIGELTPTTWPAWAVVRRCVVPGWSHLYLGQRTRAHLFFWSFVACLLQAILSLGTQFGSIAVGLAFSVHSAAASDVFNQGLGHGTTVMQIGRSILVTIGLAVLIYLPIAWALSRVALIREVQIASGPLQPNDVVLVNCALRGADWPRPGQVIVYELNAGNVQGWSSGREHVYYAIFGERLDRVLARAGDQIDWNRGVLTVNGVVSSLRPLNPVGAPARVRLTVPAEHVFVLPTTSPRLRELPEAEYAQLACVPVANVAGSVCLRYRPFSRMGVIR